MATTKRNKKPRVFEIWKEYEQIAMHFNELLLQLRIRALAGIAAISALVGFLSKGDTPTDFKWGIVATVLLLLAFVWIAIWLIDAKYYKRLLFGSVRAVLEVEKLSNKNSTVSSIQMSHRIKEAVEGDFSGLDRNPFWKDAVWWFYVLVFIALLIGFYISLAQHCVGTSNKSIAHTHGICKVVTHWGETS